MPFDDLDKKIKEAADHHHPAYDEQAWLKMKRKLDKHLPEKKDDRRRLFFLLFSLLFLAGGAFFIFNKNTGGEDNQKNTAAVAVPTKAANNNSIESTTLQKKELPAPGETPGDVIRDGKTKIDKPTDEVTNTTAYNNQIKKKAEKNNFIANKSVADGIEIDELSLYKIPTVKNIKIVKNKKPLPVKVQKPAIQKSDIVSDAGNDISDKKNFKPANDITTAPVKNEIPASEITTGVNKTNIKDTVSALAVESKNESPESKKQKPKKKGSFMITLSAWADVSAVGIDKIGTAAMQYGGGIGYNFSNGITLRTGFYAGKKIYSADSADYNPPAAWWQYYPGLKKIDADCKIYEIPLFISYNFRPVKNHSWFVSSGISSVIMKRETYDYLYKGAWNQYVTTRRTYNNENKHFFSVLTLSGGYTYNLNKRVAFSAEPYFKMPLTGIGFGKIKLNSSGVLFSMSVKPFSKKQ
jgi:hypothetical protein